MRDGLTRKLETPLENSNQPGFLDRFRASVIVLSGAAAGSEFSIDHASVVMGRGPDVDLSFPDSSMSREHACLEVTAEGIRIRDLGSSNGVRVNESPTLVCELKHGDRVALGEHVFQLVLEKRERQPRTYHISEDD